MAAQTIRNRARVEPRRAKSQAPRTWQVRDLMTEKVYTLGPHDSFEEAVELMDARHVRHLPIVDRDGDIVGLVTQRDLARSAFGGAEELPISVREAVLSRRKLREIMATEIDTAEADTDLREAATTLLENKIGCLPVVEGSRLVGILTEADFVRRFVEQG